jgi:hypothetical protein
MHTPAKVRYLEDALAVKKVFRLDVPVNYALQMHVLQTFAKLEDIAGDLLFTESVMKLFVH